MDFSASRFSGRIPANFGALMNSSCPLFSFLRALSPVTGGLGAASAAAVLLLTVALPGFIYLTKRKNKNKPRHNATCETLEDSTFDPFVNGIHPDAEFAEELQFQEAIVASLYTSLHTSSSSAQASPSIHGGTFRDEHQSFCDICLDNKESWEMFKNSLYAGSSSAHASPSIQGGTSCDEHQSFCDICLDNKENWEMFKNSLYAGSSRAHASPSIQGGTLRDEHQSFCDICLDNKESWEMLKNESCTHSFCYECTSNHIMAKIAEKAKVVSCPGVNCGASLDVNACRFLISDEALTRWNESLCQAMILDSQKLYCPFRDCSALLVNDSETSIEKIGCPLCKRLFCAACRVPWHSEFTCKEFQKLNAKKGGIAEGMVKMLAKKKNWQKCPNCKIFVEKTEGCIHMTCRCAYEFCYRCGVKWTCSHVCRKK